MLYGKLNSWPEKLLWFGGISSVVWVSLEFNKPRDFCSRISNRNVQKHEVGVSWKQRSACFCQEIFSCLIEGKGLLKNIHPHSPRCTSCQSTVVVVLTDCWNPAKALGLNLTMNITCGFVSWWLLFKTRRSEFCVEIRRLKHPFGYSC